MRDEYRRRGKFPPGSIPRRSTICMAAEAKQLDDTIEIVTPENIAFEYRVAGPFRRVVAYLIDMVLRIALISIASIALYMSLAWLVGEAMLAVTAILSFGMTWFYGGLFETFMNGQTPGKRMLGIRVLTVEGQPINGLQAMLRNLLRYVDLFPVVLMELLPPPMPLVPIPVAFLGLGFMTLTRRYQRLGDLVCDTMVIVEERQWLLGVTRLDDPRAVQLAAYLPMKFQVSRSLAKAIAAYV